MCQSCDWRTRELNRFASGEYHPLPAIDGIVYPTEHYVHLSVTKTETDFVAYTPSVEYGERDRQIRLKFGKYLRKAFPDMTDADIQRSVNTLRSKLALDSQPAVLHFATDRDTINEIFETPMCACDSTYLSCMYGKFTAEIRPYHVYADSPDVAVAYVRAQGAIVSRSVVSTKDKVWIRTYSRQGGDSAVDCETLKSLLTAAGYKKGELYGNRLTKLKTCGVMLPYIDNGGAYVSDQGDYWEVVKYYGDYEADQTDGTASDGVERCPNCENPQDACSCIYCECCGESYAEGCDRCLMCPICDGCTEHYNCSCNRCSHCTELIEHTRRAAHCECDRCGECGDLERDCNCDKCDDCGELTENCECSKDEDTEDETTNDGHTITNAEVSQTSTGGNGE